ncbi:NADP-dependent oxidoreductase [Streptomyces sp. NPDC090088]|uniref:NADP-dependent oxidoreductase n=1 Tax=Streptomyces sp. NPDC090088 TaxID=3365944 RepID=UPI003821EDCE
MRAATYHAYGDPSVLKIEDVPEPHAGPGRIRIRVQAASVNPIDWKLRAGFLQQVMPQQLPAIPGQDAAGVVDEVGDGVTGTAVGDRVFGLSNTGTAAEYAVLTAWAPVPDAWTTEQAAAAGVAGETAIRVLDLLGVGAGSTLLIEGAAGGVGSAAAQIALARGATVIGTAGEGNHEYLRSLGAMPTTYGPGLADRVRALAPAGVDAILDVAGAGSLPDLTRIAPSADAVVTIADPTAQEHGVRLSATADDPASAIAEAAALGSAGGYTPHISATYRLARITEAHTRSQVGHARGKLVITI